MPMSGRSLKLWPTSGFPLDKGLRIGVAQLNRNLSRALWDNHVTLAATECMAFATYQVTFFKPERTLFRQL